MVGILGATGRPLAFVCSRAAGKIPAPATPAMCQGIRCDIRLNLYKLLQHCSGFWAQKGCQAVSAAISSKQAHH